LTQGATLKDCLSTVGKKPITVLVLELILQFTGATLRPCFLEKLATLSEKHNFYFIVDEILTAGRTETILYTQQMPQTFQDRVQSAIIGKWLGMGVHLIHPKNTPDFNHDRGETTGTNYNEAIEALKLVEKHIKNVPKKGRSIKGNRGEGRRYLGKRNFDLLQQGIKYKVNSIERLFPSNDGVFRIFQRCFIAACQHGGQSIHKERSSYTHY
jgi:hypothetical protein